MRLVSGVTPARFQSTLPLRGATSAQTISIRIPRFQSTLPLRGATSFHGRPVVGLQFQSTLPLRGATRFVQKIGIVMLISIHAPLAGSDVLRQFHPNHSAISIHAPLAGSDQDIADQDTNLEHFNPRSPCGERPAASVTPHVAWLFQSTLPLRGATESCRTSAFRETISIHAPLAGSD